jgi:glycosyltransferase involved in cell wall biosynthesis
MTPTAPLISICIPAYNRPDGLRRALQSLLPPARETDPGAVEIIVSDDSDDPRVERTARSLLAAWPGPWRYARNQPRLGMVENWNRAAELAAGTFIWILHDDDLARPGALPAILESLRHDLPATVLLFGVHVVTTDGRIIKKQEQNAAFLSPKEAVHRLLSDSSWVRFPGLVMRREAWKTAGGFHAEWKETADLDMWLRLFAAHGVTLRPPVIAAYTVHPQAQTSGMFNADTIRRLLRLFARTAENGLLSPAEVTRCRWLFFHQFVLAGAWRHLRRLEVKGFSTTMALFDLPELKSDRPPGRWLPHRLLFGALHGLLKLLRNLSQSGGK